MSKTFFAVCVLVILAMGYALYLIGVAIYMLGCCRKFNRAVDVILHRLVSFWEDCAYDILVVAAALVVIVISLYGTF